MNHKYNPHSDIVGSVYLDFLNNNNTPEINHQFIACQQIISGAIPSLPLKEITYGVLVPYV